MMMMVMMTMMMMMVAIERMVSMWSDDDSYIHSRNHLSPVGPVCIKV